jgi:hypothetical protein
MGSVVAGCDCPHVVNAEADESQGPGLIFHFSESPTVTAGFLAFVFDIRREQK